MLNDTLKPNHVTLPSFPFIDFVFQDMFKRFA